MPLYLVSIHFVPGPTTVAMPTTTWDYEIEAGNLNEAARKVLDHPRPGHPEGASLRQRVEAYTDKPILPDLTRYDGVCDIVDRDPSTLPRAVSIAAIEAAMDEYAKVAGIETEDEPEIAVYHLIQGTADHLSARDIEFDVILKACVREPGSQLRSHSDAISRMSFEAPAAGEWSISAGRQAMELYGRMTGGQHESDEDLVAKDMIHAMAALARRDGFDLVAILANVSEDRMVERLQAAAAVPGR